MPSAKWAASREQTVRAQAGNPVRLFFPFDDDDTATPAHPHAPGSKSFQFRNAALASPAAVPIYNQSYLDGSNNTNNPLPWLSEQSVKVVGQSHFCKGLEMKDGEHLGWYLRGPWGQSCRDWFDAYDPVQFDIDYGFPKPAEQNVINGVPVTSGTVYESWMDDALGAPLPEWQADRYHLVMMLGDIWEDAFSAPFGTDGSQFWLRESVTPNTIVNNRTLARFAALDRSYNTTLYARCGKGYVADGLSRVATVTGITGHPGSGFGPLHGDAMYYEPVGSSARVTAYHWERDTRRVASNVGAAGAQVGFTVGRFTILGRVVLGCAWITSTAPIIDVPDLIDEQFMHWAAANARRREVSARLRGLANG